MTITVKVRKDNAKGYHIRNIADLAPDDVLFDEPASEPAAEPERKPRGRPRKQQEPSA